MFDLSKCPDSPKIAYADLVEKQKQMSKLSPAERKERIMKV